MEKHLGVQEKEKKDKYLKVCTEQGKSVVTFVCTIDGVLAQKAIMTLKQIVQALVKKLACHQPLVQNYVNKITSVVTI